MEFDRPRLLELLEQLGADDDTTVLAAAREADGIVRDSDFNWDDLLLSEEDFEEEEDEDEIEEDEHEADADEGEVETVSVGQPPADLDEDARIIDRLMANDRISDDMRNELADLKQGMAEGEYDAMDSRYVHALSARLNV